MARKVMRGGVNSESIKKILMGAIILVLIYVVFQLVFSKSEIKIIDGIKPANVEIPIDNNSLPVNKYTQNFTYSMWFYVNDWTNKYGNEKILLQKAGTSTQGPIFTPKVTLDGTTNNLKIEMSCPMGSNVNDTQLVSCTLENIPFQKWVNVTLSLNTRALDVYMDGKLARTCVMPNIVHPNTDGKIAVFPGDQGFNGFVSNYRFIPDRINPAKAYDIYKKGPGSPGMFSGLNKYSLKFSVLDNNVEKYQYQL